MLLSPIEVVQFWGWSGLALTICAFLGCVAGLVVYYVAISHLLQSPRLRNKQAERELREDIAALKAKLYDASHVIGLMAQKNLELERNLAHARQMAGVIAGGEN